MARLQMLEAEALGDTQGEVKDKALLNALAYTLLETVVE